MAQFMVHAWFIWRRRCNVIFDREAEPWQLVLQHAATMLKVLQKPPSSATDQRWVKWQPPPEGWVALNVDGSSLGNPGRAGAGGVFRDGVGCWCYSFSTFVGISEILKAELLAMLYGLQL